jgi:hypothetical protein
MKNWMLLILMILPVFTMEGQKASSKEKMWNSVSELPRVLNESSGLIYLENGNLLSHNDSGGKAELYEFEPGSGDLVRVIKVIGARNVDWEEIASDSTYIYLGDFGNNLGTRQHLLIYRISKEQVEISDDITPDIIRFKYPDQTSFRSRNFHNYDCEAMIVVGEKIFLFSKNRSDFRSDIYIIHSKPGEYVAEKKGTLETEGLITAADINANGDKVALLGYTFLGGNQFRPFMFLISDFEGMDLLSGQTKRIELEMRKQTEGLCFYDDTKVYFSEEEENLNKGFLFQMDLSKVYTSIREN